MQLSFDLGGVTPLLEAQARLLDRFGPQRDEIRHDPVSQLVKALVSSQTYDAVSGAAYARLRLRYRDWTALMRAPEEEVRALIAEVTHPEKKAPFLIAALNFIHARKGRLTLEFLAEFPCEFALAWLELLPGVGRKIAAAVVNFSTLHGYAFVIDTHVLRVTKRLGWISRRVETAKQAYEPLMKLMPVTWDADDLYELHWLMKQLGQSLCTYAQPNCRQCPLRSLCANPDPGAPLPEHPDESGKRAPEIVSNNNAALKAQIARLGRGETRANWGAVPFDDARIDACLPNGGLQLGHWHEIGSDQLERESPAAATGFVAVLARRALRDGTIVWTLRRDDLHAPGLQTFGLDPDRVIMVRVDKDADVLSVQEDALRTRGVTVAVGEIEKIDPLAGRRLQLVCEKGGATGFVLRRKLYGTRLQEGRAPIAAAATRWRVAAAPCQTHEPGLGPPRWVARLERCRGGRSGAWIMETQNAAGPEAGNVRVVAELADHALATDHGDAERKRLRHHEGDGERAALGGG